MEELYNKIEELLTEIESIRWVDWDANQLNENRPPVDFPCALIDISALQCEDIDLKLQRVNTTFTITLGFKQLYETNSKVPQKQKKAALEYFYITKEVYKKLQGFCNEQFFPFSRKLQRNDNKIKGLKKTEMIFSTAFDDHSASS